MDKKTEYESSSLVQSSSTVDPPPAYIPTDNRTLTIYYQNWHSSIVVKDASDRELFVTHGTTTSTHIDIMNGTGQKIGHSKRSWVRSKIEVDIEDPSNHSDPTTVSGAHTFEMHNTAGFFGGSPRYTSPAFGGEQLTWKNKAMAKEIVYMLTRKDGGLIARFKSDPKRSIGEVEFLEDGAMEGEKFDEVMVGLLSLLHRKLEFIEVATYSAIS